MGIVIVFMIFVWMVEKFDWSKVYNILISTIISKVGKKLLSRNYHNRQYFIIFNCSNYWNMGVEITTCSLKLQSDCMTIKFWILLTTDNCNTHSSASDQVCSCVVSLHNWEDLLDSSPALGGNITSGVQKKDSPIWVGRNSKNEEPNEKVLEQEFLTERAHPLRGS